MNQLALTASLFLIAHVVDTLVIDRLFCYRPSPSNPEERNRTFEGQDHVIAHLGHGWRAEVAEMTVVDAVLGG